MIFSVKVAGIEFSGDEARVAVMKTGGRTPTVLELVSCRAEYEDPEDRFQAMVSALDTALSRLNNTPAVYVLCSSARYAVVRTISIPFRGRRRVAAAVPFELEPYLAFPIEDLLVDFKVVAEFDGETEVLAIGVRRNRIEEELAIIEGAGLEVEAVNLEVVGLTGLWHSLQKKTKGLRAVLHVRESSSCLAITHNNGLAYLRFLPCSAADLAEQPEVVARETQNTIRAFTAKWRGAGEINELDVTGAELDDGIRESFSAALRLPVNDSIMIPRLKNGARALARAEVWSVVVPRRDAGAEEALPAPETEALRREEAPEVLASNNRWDAALGAAQGASGGAYAVDFMRVIREWRGAARPVVAHLMFSSCLALLVLVGWAFYYHQGTVRNREEAARIEAITSELDAEIDVLKQEGLTGALDTAVFNDPTLLDILDEVVKRMPDGKVTITDIRMSQPEAQSWWIRIQGTVQDADTFKSAFEDLRKSALFHVDPDADLSLQGEMLTFAVKLYRAKEESQ
jgi:hypothetical protein